MPVPPLPLPEVISVTPEMAPSRRSSGEATLDASTEGLPPGSEAFTEITG